MKHVIVINTVDPTEGKPLSIPFQSDLIQKIEELVQAEVGEDLCYTEDRFNVDSAIEAVHEMYNAPKWNRGETGAQLVGALRAILKDHDERGKIYPETESQPHRVAVMEQGRKAIADTGELLC